MRGIGRLLILAACVACAAPLCADWADVGFVLQEGEANAVDGPGEAYDSARPATGDWTASWPLGNHAAALAGTRIRVHSAKTVTFRDHNANCGASNQNSHLVLRVTLSEPVSAFRWDIGDHGQDVTPGALLAARYGTDGETWADAYVYMPGQKTVDPPPVDVTLAAPSAEIYLGWFTEVPQDGRAWWNMGTTGALTFAPVGETLPAIAPRALASVAALRGPRLVPSTFFGTTTHVNTPLSVELMGDLGMHCARLDFLWLGLEPEPGEYRFPPDFWIIK
ncbi:MAG TPA: hypothetical protein QGH10_13370, partial [Armatimonadota bacterium]|nr:hypothetical protein [Armatimonadota bacterium]